MTSRQRLGIVLVTSALVGGICLPAMAGELTPAQSGNAAAAPAAQPAPAAQATTAPAQAAQPAAMPAPKAAKVTPMQHRLARAHIAPAAPVQREVQVAISEPAPSGSRVVAFATLLGIAY